MNVDKVYQQYEAVRRSGKANMLNINLVQRIAYESGYHELVNAIEYHSKDWYMNFANEAVSRVNPDDELDVEPVEDRITVEVEL